MPEDRTPHSTSSSLPNSIIEPNPHRDTHRRDRHGGPRRRDSASGHLVAITGTDHFVPGENGQIGSNSRTV